MNAVQRYAPCTWNERFIPYSWSLNTDLFALYNVETDAAEEKYTAEVKHYRRVPRLPPVYPMTSLTVWCRDAHRLHRIKRTTRCLKIGAMFSHL